MSWMSLLTLFACTGAPEPDAPHGHDHADPAHDHAEPAHGHAVPAAPDHAAQHGAGSGHMAEMAATRTRLRETLGEAYDQPVPGLEQASVEGGKAVYDPHCASCHGPAGKGDGPAAAGLTPPPGDLTDAFHARYYSDAARVWIIRNGIEGTAMPAFQGQLSEAETIDVYAYVRTMREPAAPAAAPAHGAHDGHGH